jgi:hypothetical protein
MPLFAQVDGTAIQRERLPVIQYVLRYGLKTLFGITRMNALPPLLFSDEAVMQLGGFNAQQVRQGICQRGAPKRQGERTSGPLGSDTPAKPIVTLNLRDVEAVFHGSIRALAKAGLFGAKVTAMADGTDRETTERDTGCGQVSRQVRVEDTRGRVHASELTVGGWTVRLLIDAVTTMPLAVKVVPIQEPEILSWRALVTQAQTNLGRHACRHTVVCDRGFWDGTDLWGLD